jgi:tetratricopeptide (TPR) repeat protein
MSRPVWLIHSLGLAAALAGPAVLAQQPAQEQAGQLKQRDMSLVRLAAPEELKTPPRVPHGYAIVIGISVYRNLEPSQNLTFAEKDAENLYSALISKEAGNMEFENVKKLIGPQATLQNIRDALEVWLPSHAQETDRVVVYFVGHGTADRDGRGFLIPYDFDPRTPTGTAYPMRRLGEVFSNVKARWKVLLIDACHSGKITVDSTPSRLNEGLRGLPQGFLTLTSSRASEQSFEDPQLAGGNGVFSYFLVRGWLGEADVDPRDGVVTADELVSYVKREVKNYAKAQGKQQTPLEFGDFPDDMILGFSPTVREKLVATLPSLSNGSLVIEANLADVDVSIDGQRYGASGPGKPLRVPGLASGLHTVRGVRMGYDPVSVEVNLIPGGEQTVSLRLLYQRTVKQSAKDLYGRGASIWEQSKASPSDLRKAADALSRALKEDPSYSQAALELCRVQQAQDDGAAALKSCLRAIAIDPDYVEARSMAGVLLMENGDYPEAVRQLQLAAAEDSQSTFVASLLAEALHLADRPQDAEAAANRAIKLDGTSGQAYLIRGEARRAQKNFDEAIEDYHRAIEVQEFRSGVVRTAAFWAIGMGMRKHRSGTQFLYHSQKASADYGLCAAELGRANYLRAIKYCQNSLSTERDDPETLVLLAECYKLLFNNENRRAYLLEAKSNLEAVLRINPNIEQAAVLRQNLKEITELLSVVR